MKYFYEENGSIVHKIAKRLVGSKAVLSACEGIFNEEKIVETSLGLDNERQECPLCFCKKKQDK